MADANKGIEMEMPKERMIMIGTCSACSVHLILASAALYIFCVFFQPQVRILCGVVCMIFAVATAHFATLAKELAW